MQLPRRIAEGGAGEWERKVIQSAGMDVPSKHLRAQVVKRLGLAVGAAGITSATTTAAKAFAGALWVNLGVGVAAGLITVGVASYATRPVPAPAEPSRQESTVHEGKVSAPIAQRAAPGDVIAVPAPVAAAPAVVEGRATAVDATLHAPTRFPVEPAQVARDSTAPRSRPTKAVDPASRAERAPAAASNGELTGEFVEPARPIAAPPQTKLAAEIAAINVVHTALAAKDPTAALGGLDQYEHEYPSGQFALEAQVLRMDAMSKLGDKSAVKRLAARFLAEHPDSPYARHVRSFVTADVGTNR